MIISQEQFTSVKGVKIMYSSPPEIADFTVIAGVKKANLSSVNQFLLGVLAGAFGRIASCSSRRS